jgi:four helix bundle protein
MEYKSFEDMPVWQKSMELAVKIFKLTEKLPKQRRFRIAKP